MAPYVRSRWGLPTSTPRTNTWSLHGKDDQAMITLSPEERMAPNHTGGSCGISTCPNMVCHVTLHLSIMENIQIDVSNHMDVSSWEACKDAMGQFDRDIVEMVHDLGQCPDEKLRIKASCFVIDYNEAEAMAAVIKNKGSCQGNCC